VAAVAFLGGVTGQSANPPLDRDAARWIDETLGSLPLDEKIGQLIVPSFYTTFVSSDSEVYDDLVSLVHEQHVGGFHVFGGREPAPGVLLNPTYDRSTLGPPLDAASLLNRLQAIARVPLLVTADFETGVGFRLAGATTFPRAMAFGAAGDEGLAFEAGRITAVEGRATGVHVNFAPVVDVNNNPRNPVINTRSFGEDPAFVSALASAFARGLEAGGMIATAKHFPGHGDTDVDSHLGLPLIKHPRERLDQIELAPFRAAIAAGTDAVMTAHIELPSLDPTPGTPTTFSERIVSGLLRNELGFEGLIYTDSMSMEAVSELAPPGEGAVRALQAGHDVVLHSPDPRAAFAAVKAAALAGDISLLRIDESVRRVLTAKARLGLHRSRTVSLDSLPVSVGTRVSKAVAQQVSERSLTLIQDARASVPLDIARDRSVLVLSILDYPSGWGIAAPGRTFIPELRKRWPDLDAIELSDRTPLSDVELVAKVADRYEAIIAAVFVRTAAYSGRMDLAPMLVDLLNHFAEQSATRGQPFVTMFFGNPYAATFLTDLPAMLLTYDFYDLAELSAARALAGEVAIGGKLPVSLGDRFPIGHGLTRPATK
jgi:beta-N-acetylhexosaminidase